MFSCSSIIAHDSVMPVLGGGGGSNEPPFERILFYCNIFQKSPQRYPADCVLSNPLFQTPRTGLSVLATLTRQLGVLVRGSGWCSAGLVLC